MNQLKIAILYILFMIIIGTIGFATIEHLSLLDAFYLTIITISTVGYGDIVPTTPTGKIFAIFFIICAVGTAGYTLMLILRIIIEDYMNGEWVRYSMLQKITKLNQHVIICGAGRVGQQVIMGLKTIKTPFVVIESNPDKAKLLVANGILTVCGDAKLDKILQTAGVKKANILVSTLSDDADNVYVTLSAKSQNCSIIIAARADEEEAHSKLKQAGASMVISPSISGGRQILAAITHPLAHDFFQNMFYNQEFYVDMAEIHIGKQSKLVGKQLEELWIKETLNVTVAAINRSHSFLIDSLERELIKVDDILIVIGMPVSIQNLEKLASG